MNGKVDEVIVTIRNTVMSATAAYFQKTLDIAFLSTETYAGEINMLEPRDMTTIIAISGPVKALIAFCFDETVVSHLVEIETAGLEIPGDELNIYRHDVVAEIANIILGHSLKALAGSGEAIALSPPLVLEGKGSFRRPKGANFAHVSYKTHYGYMDVDFISPVDLGTVKSGLVINSGVKL